ncbi:MAG TPA: class I SAM-dependent methyltransferase [Fusobacterium sp.]|uniref:class I SAM-dependent methyltransferase n=1 Tax=Fusobacterium sp. TaxID=68766 RepID=UPI002F4137F6
MDWTTGRKQYPSFSQKLCKQNASCEGVGNVTFLEGNAIKMDYPDESFDFVTSNYVYWTKAIID